MQVKIQKISRKEREIRNGKQAGTTKMSVSIMTEQYKDKWLGGWEDDVNKDWKEGDDVDVQIEQNGEYLNFKAVKPFVVQEQLKTVVSATPSVKTSPSEDKWDKIAIGKVRHGVACEFIRLGEPLTKDTINSIDKWVDYIMTGKLLTKEEKEIDDYIGDSLDAMGDEYGA